MIVFFNKTNLLLVVTLLLCRANRHTKHLRDSLVTFNYNGNNAINHFKTTTFEVPYHVLIAYHNLYCSGALILSRVVVTAASCFVKWQGQRVVVKVGSDTLTSIGQVIEVVDVKLHEYFGHSSLMDNDIALLILQEHVKFDSNVQKIILLEQDKVLRPGLVIDVSGYAGQHSPKYANSLLWTEMTVLDQFECTKHYPALIVRSNFCAKYVLERCLKDNGGPAVYKDKLVGILSYGATNTKEPYVAVLTNVTYFYKWISLNVMRYLAKYCVEPVKVEYESYSSSEGSDV